MIRHSGPISGVAASSGRVATAGYDNRVILWEGSDARFCASHDHLANQCRFSDCGRFLVSASSDHSARIWSAADLRLLAVLGDHEDDVEMAAFNSSGERVATASRDHSVRVFDRSGAMRHRLDGHRADVISVEWSADGRELVSSSDDGTVRRWCAETGTPIAVIDLGDVEADTLVQAGSRIYVGTDAGEIVLLHGGQTRHFPTHAAGIKRLAFDPASRTLVSASYDRVVKRWRLGADGCPQLACETIAPPAVWLRSFAFNDRGGLVLGSFGGGYATCDASLSRWDTGLVAETAAINAVQFWQDACWTVGDFGIVRRDGETVRDLGSLCNFLIAAGGRLLTGGHLGIVYDALSGEPLYRHNSPLNCAAITPTEHGHRVFIGSYTGDVILLGASDGGVRHVQTAKLHGNAVKGLACNARHLFSVSATGAAALHALPSLGAGEVLHQAHDKISNGAVALPDGRFASVSRDRLLRLWSGTHATAVATPHSHSIKCVAACPLTGLIATAAYNGVVAIFDARDSRWPLVCRPTSHGVSSIAWATAAGAFVAASYDGRVYRVGAGSFSSQPASH